MRVRRLMLLALPLALTGCGYNKIQTLDEKSATAKQQIAVQLQRRADLVPNLVQTVKGYAQHEEETFTNVAKAQAGLAGAVSAGDVQQMANANQQLTGALSRLLAISITYPQLKANEGFIRLQDELSGTENRIAVARIDYNNAVNEYNSYIRQFPAVLTAKVVGAKAREYFNVTATAAEAPKVDFNKKS